METGAATATKRISSSQRARRAAILDAAIGLLQHQAYDRIHVRDVAQAADVALATLYRYFPSKERLYAHALVAWGDSFEAAVRVKNHAARSDAARLLAVLKKTLRAYERNPNFYRLMMALTNTEDRESRSVFKGFTEQFFRQLDAALPDTDPRDAATIKLIAAAILDVALRESADEEMPVSQIHAKIERMVSLIFDKPRRREGARD